MNWTRMVRIKIFFGAIRTNVTYFASLAYGTLGGGRAENLRGRPSTPSIHDAIKCSADGTRGFPFPFGLEYRDVKKVAECVCSKVNPEKELPDGRKTAR